MLEQPIAEKTYLRKMNQEHPGARVRWVLNRFYDSNRQFAEALGMSAAGVGKIVKEEVKPSHDVYYTIKKLHPEISLEWLVMGDGSEIKNEDPCEKVREDNKKLRKVNEGLVKLIEDL